jgi:hypothetical protein
MTKTRGFIFMKKILILYTSVGLGHKVIAENMGFYLVRGGYDVIAVVEADLVVGSV